MSARIFLFDLMDTVAEDPFHHAVPAALGLSLPEILAVKNPRAWISFEAGEIDEEGYFAAFYRPGVEFPPFTREEFRRAMQEHHRFLPGMESLLDDLAAGGARLAIASNYPSWFEVVRSRLALDRWFEAFHISCELRVRKPDPLFFERALERSGAAASEVVFIDDREPNVRAASTLGIEAIRFEGAVALRERLGLRG